MAIGITSAILTVASFGMNILGAYQQRQAAERRADIQEYQAAVQYHQERSQIQRQARQRTEQLQQQYRQVRGAQQAAFGHAGIIGGRTRRLVEARLRGEKEMARGRTRAGRERGLRQAEQRQEMAALGAQMQRAEAGRQFGIDLLGAGLQVGQQLYGAAQTPEGPPDWTGGVYQGTLR